MSNWIEDARKRIASEVTEVIADTTEKAQEYGCRLGDTVRIRNPRLFTGSDTEMQERLDETIVTLYQLG